MSNPIEELTKMIQQDTGYAWTWHCNISCCAMDEGMEHASANKVAARFMKLAFDVDTTPLIGKLTGSISNETI
jgi:dihydroorotate dehydrogenase